jgi:GT2 family glycosyltransferase
MLFLLLLAPLDWLLMTLLLCTELMGHLLRRISPRKPPTFAPPRPECSFVIVNWNGRAALSESLPALLLAARSHGGNHEVIVVDNNSIDGSEEFVRKQFPPVRIIKSEENLYFGSGNRRGISFATRDILVLMNSDTVVDADFIAPLLAAFGDPAVFGVASLVRAAGGQFRETGMTTAYFDDSDLKWDHQPVSSVNKDQSYCPVFWLHRGALAMDHRKYLWLGGLDGLYDPFYLEDADLSYRAWKVGWRCLLSFGSRVSHRHHIGVSRHHAVRMVAAGEAFLRLIVRRNRYIFFWKNIDNFSMLFKHGLLAAPKRVQGARMWGSRAKGEAHSYFAALKRLPFILKGKLLMARCAVRTDPEILALVTCGRPSSTLSSEFGLDVAKGISSQASKADV